MENERKSIWKRWYMFIVYFFVGLMIIGAFLPNQDFEMGMKAYNDQDYVSAYEYLSKVKSDDEGYKQAQSLLPDLKIKADSVNSCLAKVDADKQANEAKSEAEKQRAKYLKDSVDNYNEKINRLFNESNLYGFPDNLADEIKNKMNDASSFEVVDYKHTPINDKSEMVLIHFRGTNTFGAKVLQTALATIDLNGNVLTLEFGK